MDEFLANVPHEGEILPDTETDTQPESPSETKPTEESTDSSPVAKQDEKAVPFHEDPRVQDYISRQVDNRIQEELQRKFSPQEETKIPPYWNGDADSYHIFLEDQRRIAREEADVRVKALRQESEREQQRVKEATDWFEQNVAELEASGKSIDRNRLAKKAMDEELIDTKGRWNFKAAHRLIEAEEKLDPVNKDARKKIAVVSDSKAEPEPRAYKTQEDFKRRRPW